MKKITQHFHTIISTKSKRRALSTVVTSAILISAVAIMGVLVVAWSNSNLASQQKSLESTFATNMNKLKETLVFENVYFDSNPSKAVNITLYNSGEIGLNVTDIKFVNYTDGTQLFQTELSGGGIVSKDTLAYNASYSWIDDKPFDIVVTTERDSIFKKRVLAP